MQDLLAGTIDIMCAEASQTLAHVTANKMKAFAVMGRKRYAGLPNVPTMEEIGITGMDISFWHGLWAPKGTPKAVVDKLNAAAVKALTDPVVQKRAAALGMTIPERAELTPQALATSTRPKSTNGGRSSSPTASRSTEPPSVDQSASVGARHLVAEAPNAAGAQRSVV